MSLLVSLSPDARDGWMDAEWEEEEGPFVLLTSKGDDASLTQRGAL